MISLFTAMMNRRVSNLVHGRSKDRTKEMLNSLSPLTCFLNLFAINSNVIKEGAYTNIFIISKTFITFSILGSLNIFSLYFKYVYIYKHIAIALSIQLTDTAQIVYDLFQYFIDIWFIYKCERHMSMEYFKQYEQIDTILDMIQYDTIIKWELIKLLSIFTLIWLISSIADYVSWYLSFGWIAPTVYSIAYIFLFIKMLTTLDLSSHVMLIRFRLMIIGDMVYNYFSVMEHLPGFVDSYNGKITGKTCAQTELKSVTKMKVPFTDEYICKEANLLTRCYLQLTEQVAFINSKFGLRILLNSLSLLIDLIRFTNIAVRILLGTQSIPEESRYFPVISNMMRVLTCVMVLVSLVNQCENVYRQQERSINTIDHLLINKNLSDNLRAAMTQLHNLIQARPVTFSLANFFQLNNSLLVSIASGVVTYTIILVQTMN